MNSLPPDPEEILKELGSKRGPRPTLAEEYTAPTDQIEIQLAEIWSGVLRVDLIGRYDNFFSLGGDSLNMMQIANRIRAVFGVEVGFDAFFHDPTISGLAGRVRQAQLDKDLKR
jgi:aryl carrier-like protein